MFRYFVPRLYLGKGWGRKGVIGVKEETPHEIIMGRGVWEEAVMKGFRVEV